MQRAFRLASIGLILSVSLACGSDSDEPLVDAEESARLDRALRTLETVSSERVRKEVLRTCDKWHIPERPCVENAIRKDQLSCWLEAGFKRWQGAQKRGMGPWGGDKITMNAQNVCIQKLGWRKTARDSGF